jgi:hypothetical protein
MPTLDQTNSFIVNHEGVTTHFMCCVCFNITHASDAYVDRSGQKWDLCGSMCAAQAGVR